MPAAAQDHLHYVDDSMSLALAHDEGAEQPHGKAAQGREENQHPDAAPVQEFRSEGVLVKQISDPVDELVEGHRRRRRHDADQDGHRKEESVFAEPQPGHGLGKDEPDPKSGIERNSRQWGHGPQRITPGP